MFLMEENDEGTKEKIKLSYSETIERFGNYLTDLEKEHFTAKLNKLNVTNAQNILLGAYKVQ